MKTTKTRLAVKTSKPNFNADNQANAAITMPAHPHNM